jgi:uncharacterized protein involved in exopolysaccharide biosynthesis
MSRPDIMETRQADLREIGLDPIALLKPVAQHWYMVLTAAVIAGAIGVATSFAIAPKFVAETAFLPPQQQNQGSSALSSLGALTGLSAAANGKNSPEEYASLLQSVTVSDRIIGKFGLMKLWNQKYLQVARKQLLKRVSIDIGKRDGLMRVAVTDTDPKRAAAMANQYVDELRILTSQLAVTEAQQRRVFFEHLLEQTRDKLASAQSALEGSGFAAGALNSAPQTAAERYAKLHAELTAAEVKLQVLQQSLSGTAPAVLSQQETVRALSLQLRKIESQDRAPEGAGNYVTRFREFKYQETLFDLFARQYENARVDESREGGIVQVLDAATPPELKSSPTRSVFAIVGAALGLLASALYFIWRGLSARGRIASA